VTAKDLLDAEMFPDAQMGMTVESVEDGPIAKVRTIGADFVLDKQQDTIECSQRIAAERKVGLLRLPKGTLQAVKRTHQSSGAAIFSDGKNTIRINGDSLVMISCAVAGSIDAELSFTPDYYSAFHGNCNFFDPLGGISFFEHGNQANPQVQLAKDPIKATWNLNAGDVFWAGVSPPKPFNWQRSVEDRIVVYGSSYDRYMYPDDLTILRWSKHANILMLHDENCWESFQLKLIPRDRSGFMRVVKTAHESGMKMLPYTTPRAFLKGTDIEDRAKTDMNDPGVTGSKTGASAREYVKQATNVVKQFKTDGIYFDEMYGSPKSLAASYYVARSMRQAVGDQNPLNYHCTEDVLADRTNGENFGRTACPAVHAYFSFLIKGEAVWGRMDPAYTRYILGTYNISNTPAIQGHHKDTESLTPEYIDYLLRNANARFCLMEYTFFTGEAEVLREHYWPRLTMDLKKEIEPDLLRPTGVFAEFRKSVSDMGMPKK
jgi:hypothetical protein